MASRRILEKNKYQFLEKISLSPIDEESLDYSVEIDNYLKELKTYKVSLMGLSKDVPSKEDRNLFLNLALIITDDEKLKEQFTTQKKLPLKRISHTLEVPLFKLEAYENYLCAYTLLLDEKYPLLRKTLTYGPKVKEHLTEVLKFMPQGLVLHCSFRQSYLLTRHGEFYRIKNEGQVVGKFASGRKKRNPLNWKRPLGSLLIIALIAFGFYQYQINQIQNTIIVRAVGEVKVEFNSFGNLIDIIGTSPEGDKFVSSAEFEAKDMDTVLAEIIEQAYISGTIKERDELLIIISGEPLEEDFFKSGKTHDRILSYQLNPKINNDGSFLEVN